MRVPKINVIPGFPKRAKSILPKPVVSEIPRFLKQAKPQNVKIKN